MVIVDGLLERAAVDELHHVIRLAGFVEADLVDRHHAGVLQLARDLGFVQELFRLGFAAGADLLQRDDAANGAILGDPDLAHAAAGVELFQHELVARAAGPGWRLG